MSDRIAIIKALIEKQKKFIAYEREHGLKPKDYYAPDAEHELSGYAEDFNEQAMKLIEIAHAEKGSTR